MAGFAMPDDKGDLSGVPWKDGYDKVKWLSKDQLTKENVLDAEADLRLRRLELRLPRGRRLHPGRAEEARRPLVHPHRVLPQRPYRDLARHHAAARRPLHRPHQPRKALRRREAGGHADRRLQEADRGRQEQGTRPRAPRSSSTTAARTSPSPPAATPPPRRSSPRPAGSTSCTTSRTPGRRSAGRASSQRDPDVIVICDYGDVERRAEEEVPAVLRPAGGRLRDQEQADLRPRLRRPGREPPQPVGDRPPRRLPPDGGRTASGPRCGPRPCPRGRCR